LAEAGIVGVEACEFDPGAFPAGRQLGGTDDQERAAALDVLPQGSLDFLGRGLQLGPGNDDIVKRGVAEPLVAPLFDFLRRLLHEELAGRHTGDLVPVQVPVQSAVERGQRQEAYRGS
jgi:hypothetical protein